MLTFVHLSFSTLLKTHPEMKDFLGVPKTHMVGLEFIHGKLLGDNKPSLIPGLSFVHALQKISRQDGGVVSIHLYRQLKQPRSLNVRFLHNHSVIQMKTSINKSYSLSDLWFEYISWCSKIGNLWVFLLVWPLNLSVDLWPLSLTFLTPLGAFWSTSFPSTFFRMEKHLSHTRLGLLLS